MGIPSSIIFFFLLLLLLLSLFQPSHSKTILVDGVSELKNPSVHIGDSLIFQHKLHYNLYIFRSKQAFELCNFTQATLLTKPNSTTFMWNPSRPGFFYYSFNNGSLKSCEEKFAIRVFPKPPESMASSPESSPLSAPSPTSGGVVSSSPASHWHSISPQASSPSSSSAPNNNASAPSAVPTVPSMLPDTGGIPFINSNPAIPLPTGETDGATIRPLATSSAHGRTKVLVGVQIPLCFMLWLLVS